ncbi:GA4 desaturase family protein [Pseudovirgaria hyperparasitica]|uniref:GA4 desaturase family protein n=1 Tax=Pseudovirgaria hyperparasitica TaxID=470096 RepID=A0A6A6VXJ0_9PEZI|nr:GA4 desaturase family protein [Pseudovirgaria hyperparasitica]KAF2753971.1 GA4 desaturase family protein [Pseudovirgaria hyperparasitica]
MVAQVDTTFNYFNEDAGYDLILGTVQPFRRKVDSQNATAHDIRGHESEFKLDTHGFELCHHPSKHMDLVNEPDKDIVKKHIYPEIEEVLKKCTGANNALVFSHVTRNGSPEKIQAQADASTSDEERTTTATPARVVHIDQSAIGANALLEDNLPADLVTKVKSGRWALINVWRPLKKIPRDPLAMCDARSVAETDKVELTARLPTWSGAKYGASRPSLSALHVRYNEAHRWYFADEMTEDEVWVFKIWESLDDGSVAGGVAHSSFVDPRTRDVRELRESMEIRSLVWWD